MDTEVWLGWIRHVFTAIGGALVLKGYTDEASMQEVVGAVMTLLGFIWSWKSKQTS